MKIKQICTGARHSLILTGKFFLNFKFLNCLENDEIYSFGYNNYGELGIGIQ